MSPTATIPTIKKIETEQVFALGRSYRIKFLTRVSFKDGSALTFAGQLSKAQAVHQAFLQKGLEAGLSQEEAEKFAATKYPVPAGREV